MRKTISSIILIVIFALSSTFSIVLAQINMHDFIIGYVPQANFEAWAVPYSWLNAKSGTKVYSENGAYIQQYGQTTFYPGVQGGYEGVLEHVSGAVVFRGSVWGIDPLTGKTIFYTTKTTFFDPYALNIPPKANIYQNLVEAMDHPLNLPWLINQVQGGARWDYKNADNNNGQTSPQFANFGNYNYGAVFAAAGIPLEVALRGAGAIQQYGNFGRTSSPEFGNQLAPPYGDDPTDQYWIQKGYYDYLYGRL